jgi:hypothetical protein
MTSDSEYYTDSALAIREISMELLSRFSVPGDYAVIEEEVGKLFAKLERLEEESKNSG